ncbi:MAG: DUF1343 domain-containing protein [Spirochaetes bacterium]|nr:MAG: DUF1343 domain-containing protein [Spirochaetota bacterium]
MTTKTLPPRPAARPGLDVLLGETHPLAGLRVALIANQTSITSGLRYGWDALADAGVNLVRVFSPEHGIYGTEQDQAAVTREPSFPCEVVSLYGSSRDSLAPAGALLDDIDAVVFDIQDIGTRYYTFANTMAMCMGAASGRDIRFVVLDRPNPIGGACAEGPPLEEGFESFVGVFRVPVRHGLTAGELAFLYKNRNGLDLDLRIVRMEGWRRDMSFTSCGLPWVPPSPNMPTEDTALVYPGMCLLEGTNLSEGRGTTTPFEMFGAPWIDPYLFCREINALGVPGAHFRPLFFKPTFNKFAGSVCGGAFLHVTKPAEFRSFLAGVAVVHTALRLYPGEFAFARGVYEFNDIHPAFDLLAGGAGIRTMLHAALPLEEVAASWHETEERYVREKGEFHLYR